MRKFLFLLAVFSTAFVIRAQVPADSLMALKEVDKPPVFPGCESYRKNTEELLQCFDMQLGILLGHGLNYPSDAREKNEQGVVYIEIVIDNTGHLTDVKNINPHEVHPSLVKEAIRVIRKLPQMQPAIHKGQPVSVKYTIPVSFKLF